MQYLTRMHDQWQGDRRQFWHFREIIKTDWPFDTQDVPSGATAVPVLIDDNGTEYEGQVGPLYHPLCNDVKELTKVVPAGVWWVVDF